MVEIPITARGGCEERREVEVRFESFVERVLSLWVCSLCRGEMRVGGGGWMR